MEENKSFKGRRYRLFAIRKPKNQSKKEESAAYDGRAIEQAKKLLLSPEITAETIEWVCTRSSLAEAHGIDPESGKKLPLKLVADTINNAANQLGLNANWSDTRLSGLKAGTRILSLASFILFATAFLESPRRLLQALFLVVETTDSEELAFRPVLLEALSFISKSGGIPSLPNSVVEPVA